MLDETFGQEHGVVNRCANLRTTRVHIPNETEFQCHVPKIISANSAALLAAMPINDSAPVVITTGTT